MIFNFGRYCVLYTKAITKLRYDSVYDSNWVSHMKVVSAVILSSNDSPKTKDK